MLQRCSKAIDRLNDGSMLTKNNLATRLELCQRHWKAIDIQRLIATTKANIFHPRTKSDFAFSTKTPTNAFDASFSSKRSRQTLSMRRSDRPCRFRGGTLDGVVCLVGKASFFHGHRERRDGGVK